MASVKSVSADVVEGQQSLPPAPEYKFAKTETKDVQQLAPLLRATALSEQDAKTIFARYASNNMWSHGSLRAFLLDLQEANEFPRVVSDEMVLGLAADMKTEMKDNSVVTVSIPYTNVQTWLLPASSSSSSSSSTTDTFNSANSLLTIHDKLRAYFMPSEINKSVLVSNLSAKTTSEQMQQVFVTEGGCSLIAMLFARFEATGATQALLVMKNTDDVKNAVTRNGTDLNGLKMKVVAYSGEQFPAVPASASSSPEFASGAWFSAQMAPVLYYSKSACNAVSTRVASADRKWGVSESCRQAGTALHAKLSKFDQDYKISETTEKGMKAVSASLTSAAKSVEGTFKKLWGH